MSTDPFRYVSKASNVIKLLARQVWYMTRAEAPNIWIGRGWDEPSSSFEHGTGRALDIIVSEKVGRRPTVTQRYAGNLVANWLIRYAEALNIRHIIWNGKIWRRRYASQGWGTLPGRNSKSSVSDWHYDHIHVYLDDTNGYVPNAPLLLSAKPAPPKPKPTPPKTGVSQTRTVSLSGLLNAANTDPPRKDTRTTNWSAVLPVEDALVAEKLLDVKHADGHFGTATVEAYKKWQERLGYRGKDADGIPGMVSLTKLGNSHGFKVTK